MGLIYEFRNNKVLPCVNELLETRIRRRNIKILHKGVPHRISGLKKGDRVVFSGGIYGKVHSVDEHTVEVEVANGVVMTVEKSMIQPAPEPKTEEKK